MMKENDSKTSHLQSLRVLIVEDSEDDTLLIIRQFKKHNYDIISRRVETAHQMKSVLEDLTWDLVIADYNLPQFDAPSALSILQKTGLDIPFIVVSGVIGEETAVALMKSGAHDYIMKGNLSRLVPAVERELIEVQTRRAKHVAEEQLRESEEQFRSIFENSVDAILLTIPDGDILAANSAACRMFGRSEEEIRQVGRDGIVDYSDNRFFNADNERKAAGFYIKKEYLHIRKDGTRFPTEVSSSVYKDKDGFEKSIIIIRDITERKKTEEQLIESEEIMRYIVQHDPNAIAIFDLDLHYMAVSNRYLQDYNVKEADIIGKHHYEVFPEMPQKWKDVHCRCLAGSVERNDDDYFERPDGSITYNRWECRPWYRANNEIGGIVTYTEVTTERKEAEKALRLSEERLRLTLESVNDGVWDWDIHTGDAVFSPRCYTMLGYEHNDFPQNFQSWRKIVHPDDIGRVEKKLSEHLKSGAKYAAECRMRTKNGGWLWIETRGKVVERDHDERPVRMVGTHSDITERKEAETKLLESEERYRTAIEHSNDGVGLVKEGKHIYVNNKFLEIFGYDNPEDVVGKPTTLVVHPDYHAQQKEFRQKRQEGDNTVPEQFEFRGLKKDGTELFIEASTTKTVYRGEQVLFVFSRDITERKKMERRRELTNKILEVLNDPDEAVSLVSRVLSLLKEHTGVDAIGIRMKVGEDYPYIETDGFPEDILETDKYLCLHDENNAIARDPKNDEEPCLECMCGTVIQGRSDPALPFFTQRGSFWTNSISKFIMTGAGEAFQERMRNYYAVAGFESMVLIPLRSGTKTVGILQLNKRQPDYFTLETVESLEKIATSISIALLRRQAEEELAETAEKVRKSLIGTLQAMSLTVETKDPYTAGHQKRVSRLARMIAQEMGLAGDVIDNIRMAGAIHDIGKLAVPAEILSKPTKLSDIEMGIIKTHPQTGYAILKETTLPPVIAEIIIQHHERMNGSGYPSGLRGEQILLEAQILAVADVVEAMAFYRPYRPGLGIDIALDEIEINRGLLYNVEVADACLKLFREKRFDFG